MMERWTQIVGDLDNRERLSLIAALTAAVIAEYPDDDEGETGGDRR